MICVVLKLCMELMTVLGLWAEASSETISAVLAFKHLFLIFPTLDRQ